MTFHKKIIGFLCDIETILCELLLAFFVLILFIQIIARQVFGFNIAWSEELSTYMFVWFAYLGASVAAKMSAHNRVTFHFRWINKKIEKILLTIADIFWLAFNSYFTYLCYDFIFNRMNLFWKSQTLGIPMKYFYMILPFAFFLMSIRILVNIYLRAFNDIDLSDPETLELQKIKTTIQ